MVTSPIVFFRVGSKLKTGKDKQNTFLADFNKIPRTHTCQFFFKKLTVYLPDRAFRRSIVIGNSDPAQNILNS